MSMDKATLRMIAAILVLGTLAVLIAVPESMTMFLVIYLPAAAIWLGILIIEQLEKDAAKRRSSR